MLVTVGVHSHKKLELLNPVSRHSPPSQASACTEHEFAPIIEFVGRKCLDPFSPNSDQHQISPCNINAYSTPEVMRIKDLITRGEFF